MNYYIFEKNLRFEACISEIGRPYIGDYIIRNDTLIVKAKYWRRGEKLPPIFYNYIHKLILKEDKLWLVYAQVEGDSPIIFKNPHRYALTYRYYE
jgi:hypothetical protein